MVAAGEPRVAPGSIVNLQASLDAIGLHRDECIPRFDRYRSLLIDWNGRHNLTAITDPAEIDRRLFLDALRMVPVLHDQLGGQGTPRLVDIGSGAGFPALPLKIACPGMQMTLIEATGKKVLFLRHVIDALRLTGIDVIHGRAEDLGRDPAHRGAYDIATARAVASLAALLELSFPLLRVGGQALFPKGCDLDEELVTGRRAATTLGGRIDGVTTVVAGGSCLVRVTKTAPTQVRYPRRSGIPAREPLGSARGRQS
jgi:16S rRNA (guanine527-N7)-methyltransferase